MLAPHGWPDEVVKQYEAVRPLGQGGFGSVTLAKHKTTGDMVAMKIVVSATKQQLGYCNRELDILREISHPHIMKLLQHWQPNDSCTVMALSYSPGPTLLQLLKFGGALNFTFAQIVIAQLVDAVLCLHSRAVVHRDLKPDNIIITGASFEQEEIWDGDAQQQDPDDYISLLKKWHLTLIDFGFARALTPEDIKKKPPKHDIAQLDLDASTKRKKTLSNNKDPDVSTGSTKSTASELNRSRHLVRKMSALGNRGFAAPEITNKIQDQDLSQHDDVYSATHTLSNHVSYYGLQVDAYAVGRTMMYCFTGAPPSENVNELIDLQNHPILVIGRMLGCCSSKKDERSVRYRRLSQIPDEPLHLMKGLLLVDPQQRKTLRMARQSPYIDKVLQHQGPNVKQEIDYLSFVKNVANSGGA